MSSNKKRSRKAKNLPQFSISSGNKPPLDLLEIQRKSFCDFLERGIIDELSKTDTFRETAKFSGFTQELELVFNPDTYKLVSPNCTPKEAILKGKTYACKLYVQATLTIRFSPRGSAGSVQEEREIEKQPLGGPRFSLASNQPHSVNILHAEKNSIPLIETTKKPKAALSTLKYSEKNSNSSTHQSTEVIPKLKANYQGEWKKDASNQPLELNSIRYLQSLHLAQPAVAWTQNSRSMDRFLLPLGSSNEIHCVKKDQSKNRTNFFSTSHQKTWTINPLRCAISPLTIKRSTTTFRGSPIIKKVVAPRSNQTIDKTWYGLEQLRNPLREYTVENNQLHSQVNSMSFTNELFALPLIQQNVAGDSYAALSKDQRLLCISELLEANHRELKFEKCSFWQPKIIAPLGSIFSAPEKVQKKAGLRTMKKIAFAFCSVPFWAKLDRSDGLKKRQFDTKLSNWRLPSILRYSEATFWVHLNSVCSASAFSDTFGVLQAPVASSMQMSASLTNVVGPSAPHVQRSELAYPCELNPSSIFRLPRAVLAQSACTAAAEQEERGISSAPTQIHISDTVSIADRNQTNKSVYTYGINSTDNTDTLAYITNTANRRLTCKKAVQPSGACIEDADETSEKMQTVNSDETVTQPVKIFRPWIFLGELPLMTKRGHFILNGSPRVIVNQMARCPGIYFQEKRRGVGFEQEVRVSADLIPQRGPWLRIQSDWEGRFWARLKREGRVKYATLYEAFQECEKQYNAPLVSLVTNSSSLFPKSEILAFQERKIKEDRQKKALVRFFKNSTRYSLGKQGRLRINQRVHSSQPEMAQSRILSFRTEWDRRKQTKLRLLGIDSAPEQKKEGVGYLGTGSVSNAVVHQKYSETSEQVDGYNSRSELEISKLNLQGYSNSQNELNSRNGFNSNAKSEQVKQTEQKKRAIKAAQPKVQEDAYEYNSRSELESEQELKSTSEKWNGDASSQPLNELDISATAIAGVHINSGADDTRIDKMYVSPTQRSLCIPSAPKWGCIEEAHDKMHTIDQVVFNSQGEVYQPHKKNSVDETEHLLMSADVNAIHFCLEQLLEGRGFTDDIDHLKNRLVRTSGKLLQQQLELGLDRLSEVMTPLLGNLIQGHSLLPFQNREQSNSLGIRRKASKMHTKVDGYNSRSELEISKLNLQGYSNSQNELNSRNGFNSNAQSEQTKRTEQKKRAIKAAQPKVQEDAYEYNSRSELESEQELKSTSEKWNGDASSQPLSKLTYQDELNSKSGKLTKSHDFGTLHRESASLHAPLRSPVQVFSTHQDIQPAYGVGMPKKNKLPNQTSVMQKGERRKTSFPEKTGNRSSSSLQQTPFRWLRTSKPVNNAFREFFGSNPLSQYMDQTNPLAEITHKRRLSSMGPGGIKRETAGMEVRGIHPTHYGRVCPIETPEGKNAGLVNSPTVYGRIGKNGFMETPLYQVVQSQVQKERWTFLSAQQEEIEESSLATGDTGVTRFNFLSHLPIPVQTANNPLAHFQQVERNRVGYKALSPVQTISIATALIPFLEHDDANRALMGSNMQRQAIPLLSPERPIVGTGFEPMVMSESGQAIQATKTGCISHVSANKIILESIHSTWQPSASEMQPKGYISFQSPNEFNSNSLFSACKGASEQELNPTPFHLHILTYAEKARAEKMQKTQCTSDVSLSAPLHRRCIVHVHRASSAWNAASVAPQRFTCKMYCHSGAEQAELKEACFDVSSAFSMQAPEVHVVKRRRSELELNSNSPDSHSLIHLISPSMHLQCKGASTHMANDDRKLEIGDSQLQNGNSISNIYCKFFYKREKYNNVWWNCTVFTRCLEPPFPRLRYHRSKNKEIRKACSASASSYTFGVLQAPQVHVVKRRRSAVLLLCKKQTLALAKLCIKDAQPKVQLQEDAYESEQAPSGVASYALFPTVNRRFADKGPELDMHLISPEPVISSASSYICIFPSKMDHGLHSRSSASKMHNLRCRCKGVLQAPVAYEYNSACVQSELELGYIREANRLRTRTNLHLCSTQSSFLFKKIEQSLQLYQRSNQETCLSQRPLVREGDWVQKGDFLADCSASHSGDLALGKNVTVAYMPWEGYNFEDAIVISDRLVANDIYTSIHIERYEIKSSKNSQGKERITNQIPSLSSHHLKHLDSFGIARVSSWVQPGDILVGKVVELKRPLSPYERLAWELASRLSPNSPEREKWLSKVWLEDISLRLPAGVYGRVINFQIISTEWSEKEHSLIPLEVHVYLAVKRKIQVGDKLAGRHGNKGIVSIVLPRQDMPYLGDGSSVDMVLNPLGVPSRMNLGQIFECLLGLAGSQLGCNFKVTPFDEIAGGEASRSLVFLKLYQCRLIHKQQWLFTPTFPGKNKLFDGRTGEPFENWVTVGQAYMLKLIHMVDHKIHARSTGPYSLFTRQPVRGRSRRGGQRLGEMEVWAVEGFGAAYTLQEFLTIKSDDLKARAALQRSFYKQNDVTLGKVHISPGNPEAFRVLVSELKALCLHIQM